jgi:hypothetical protein
MQKKTGGDRCASQFRPRPKSFPQSVSQFRAGKANKNAATSVHKKSRPFAEGVSFPLTFLYRLLGADGLRIIFLAPELLQLNNKRCAKGTARVNHWRWDGAFWASASGPLCFVETKTPPPIEWLQLAED